MARPAGQLERSLAALTIGVHQGAAQRVKALSDTVTGPYKQVVHVQLTGSATATWGFLDRDVQWELPFLYAPLQWRVPFRTPHFEPGIEMTAGQGELMVIHAHVIGWTVTESQWYVGATIRFAVAAPNAATPTPFAAIAHLGFIGWGTMAETDEFA